MAESQKIARWRRAFPEFLARLLSTTLKSSAEPSNSRCSRLARSRTDQTGECPNYIMCIDGRTRVYKTGGSGGNCSFTRSKVAARVRSQPGVFLEQHFSRRKRR